MVSTPSPTFSSLFPYYTPPTSSLFPARLILGLRPHYLALQSLPPFRHVWRKEYRKLALFPIHAG